jgi:hypothetical protein
MMRRTRRKAALNAVLALAGTLIFCVRFAFADPLLLQPPEDFGCRYFLNAPFISERVLAPELREQIEGQVLSSFAQKFAPVSKDFRTTSKTNLAVIETSLMRRIGTKKFSDLFGKSGHLLEEIKSKLVIQSETSVERATSILDGDAFLSLDELIRQRKLPLDKKLNSATAYDADGVIGQQDTIFLAIKPTEIISTGKTDRDYVFGNVKFIFSKEVLDRGYFSLYPFDNSPGFLHLRDNIEYQSQKLGQAVRLYKNFIFSGTEDFDHLLRLSIVEDMFNRKKLEGPLLAQDVLGAYTRFPAALSKGLSSRWAFWELKIPTRLSLDKMVAVQIRRPAGSTEVTSRFIERLKTYAASKGKGIRLTDGFDQAAYNQAVSEGYTVYDRDYYAYTRIEFTESDPAPKAR